VSESAQPGQGGVPWDQVALFTGVVLVVPWLLTLPMHLGVVAFSGVTGMATALTMMWVPTLATAVVLATLDRGGEPRWTRRVGLTVPKGTVPRLLGVLLVALLVPIVLNTAGPFVAGALGVMELDLADLSGLRAVIEEQAGAGALDELPVPLWMLVALAPVNAAFGGVINTAVGAMGEELGWRGWLLPKLLPLGRWPAILAVGVLWGVWHAPIILLGHNYPDAPVAGVFLFVPFCVVWGVLHGWVRLVSDSVWPPALMHGTLNASAGFAVMVMAADTSPSSLLAAPVGVAGMVLPLVLALCIAAFWRPGR